MKQRWIRHALALVVGAIAMGAQAAWPEKPIKLVVPYAAGGAADALARVVVDVSGRPYLAYHAEPPTWQKLGDFDVALVPEFFRALATHGGLTLHMDLLRGQNAHHVVEAVFKAAARALGQAVALDPRGPGVPSTKGTLSG